MAALTKQESGTWADKARRTASFQNPSPRNFRIPTQSAYGQIGNHIDFKRIDDGREKTERETRPGYIYIICGVAHEDQLDKIIISMIRKLVVLAAENRIFPNIDPTYRLNYVVTTNRETGQVGKVGYSYLWVKDSRIYYALTGANFDGSPRVMTENDPDWTPPKESYQEAIRKALESSNHSWADESEITEDIEKRYRSKIKTKQLPPLIYPDMYQYTTDQFNYLHIQAVNNKEDPSTVPQSGSIILSQAWNNNIEKNELFSGKIPDWVNANDLIEQFSDYSTMEGYPKIKFSNGYNGKQVLITYSPGSHDAGFALLMTRKIYISNRSTNCIETLIFDFYHPRQ